MIVLVPENLKILSPLEMENHPELNKFSRTIMWGQHNSGLFYFGDGQKDFVVAETQEALWIGQA